MSSPLKQNTTKIQELLNTINNLPDAGGVELPELSNEGSAADLLSGKQLINGEGNIVTGTIETRTELTRLTGLPTIVAQAGYYANDTSYTMPNAEFGPSLGSVDENGAVSIIGDVAVPGFVSFSELPKMTYQLDTQGAATIMPTKESQVVVKKGKYTTGAVTVAAIPSEYITTTDATASADEIMSGETAYVNGSKVTGTFSIDSELNAQDELIAQIQAAVDNLPEVGSGGSSYDTCTVNISTDGNVSILQIAYITVSSNGKIEFVRDSSDPNSYNLTCLCGSAISIHVSLNINDINYSQSSQAYCYPFTANSYLCEIRALKDETATITLMKNEQGGASGGGSGV